MAGDEVAPQQPPQQSIRTIELPSYPPFNEHESPSIATDWEEWIEGLDVMFDAMCLINDQDKFSKLPSKQSTSADVSLTSVQRQFNVELTLD